MAQLKMSSVWAGPVRDYGPEVAGVNDGQPPWRGLGLYGLDSNGVVYAFCQHWQLGPDGLPSKGEYMHRWCKIGMEVAE